MATNEPNLADLADGTLSGPEWEAWLLAHPQQAAEVAATRQIHALLQQLRADQVELPAHFEARILSHVHRASAVRELLNLNLSGTTRALLELLSVLFSLLPGVPPDAAAAPRSADGLPTGS